MRLDWIFLPRENPCAKFYIMIIIIIIIIIIFIQGTYSHGVHARKMEMDDGSWHAIFDCM